MVQDLPQTFNPPLCFWSCLSPCREHCSLRSEWNYLLLFCLSSSGWARMTMQFLPMAPWPHVVSPLLDYTVSVSICLAISSVTWTIYVLHKHKDWALCAFCSYCSGTFASSYLRGLGSSFVRAYVLWPSSEIDLLWLCSWLLPSIPCPGLLFLITFISI